MKPDSHGACYTISSLYLDSPGHRLYYMTHDREPYRYKLRLRVYGEATLESLSFFEVKSKLRGRSEKRRLALPLRENLRLVDGELPSGLEGEKRVLAEYILYLVKRDSLAPAAVVSYEREAFAAEGMSKLRATFDSRLRIRTDELDLTLGSFGEPIMEDGECVLELKSGENLPRELTSLLGEFNLRNITYSKYGKTNFKGEKSCLTPSAGSLQTSAQ